MPTPTPAIIDWDKLTGPSRDALCARFMPSSETNPIRSWYLHAGGKSHGRLAISSVEEAKTYLDVVTKSPLYWRKTTGLPSELRFSAEVREDHHFCRYSSTPGGAWMLAEDVISKGGFVRITCDAKLIDVLIIKERQVSVSGPIPMPEAMAIAYLLFNGQVVRSSNSDVKIISRLLR